MKTGVRDLMRVLALSVLVVVPFVLRDYGLFIATELLVWALFAVSLDLLLGYTGLPSFGHAVFFGLPAYALGWCGKTASRSLCLLATQRYWWRRR